VARHVERLRARLVDALCGAGDTLVALGDVDAAIEIGNEVVALEPLGQHGYRLMIAAHVHAGRTVAARSILESCRQALDAADVALAPETEMLARVLENTAGHAGP
jgi:DNA-binding SARP family transcriptional activator